MLSNSLHQLCSDLYWSNQHLLNNLINKVTSFSFQINSLPNLVKTILSWNHFFDDTDIF